MMCLRGYTRVGQLHRADRSRKPRSLGSLGDRPHGSLDSIRGHRNLVELDRYVAPAAERL